MSGNGLSGFDQDTLDEVGDMPKLELLNLGKLYWLESIHVPLCSTLVEFALSLLSLSSTFSLTLVVQIVVNSIQ